MHPCVKRSLPADVRGWPFVGQGLSDTCVMHIHNTLNKLFHRLRMGARLERVLAAGVRGRSVACAWARGWNASPRREAGLDARAPAPEAARSGRGRARAH